MDFDTGIADRANSDGKSHSLEQGKVHVHVQALCLEACETMGDDLESFPYGVEVIESLLQTEVAQVIRTEFVAQEAGELFILFEKSVFPIRAEDMVAVLNL